MKNSKAKKYMTAYKEQNKYGTMEKRNHFHLQDYKKKVNALNNHPF